MFTLPRAVVLKKEMKDKYDKLIAESKSLWNVGGSSIRVV